MPADPKRVKEIFLAVSDAADDRAALLDRECGGDADLRQRVEALLHAHHDPATFLRQRPESTVDHRPLPGLLPGQMFDGRFKLREELGHGGMGVVFVADQTEPVQRRVALKVIREGGDTTRLLARFEQERQALALMDHPNIAKVLDAGVSDTGQPYFVMELIKGMPITDYCDKAKLTPRERLELFVPVCQAVQHAHQKGVIHRDLKPSNILVGLYDGKPVPKVIDFGVAKATGQRLSEASVYTEVGSVIGTLEYMSPEQAELNNLDIDTRSDVYALGVIMYQLLTGTVPFSRQELQSGGFAEMLRIIKEKEPPRPSNRLSTSRELPLMADLRRTEPSKLSKLMRGELDWIVMKALEKDRARRYETANGLAKDVQRFLAGDAVDACPPTLGYRIRKAYRRNRGAVLTAGTIAAVLVAATGVSVALGILARQAQHRADASAEAAITSEGVARERLQQLETEQTRSSRLQYARSIQFADTALQGYLFDVARVALDGTDPRQRGWEWHYLNRLWRSDYSLDIRPKGERAASASYSPDGRRIVTASNHWAGTESLGSVQVWNADTGELLLTVADDLPGVRSAKFCPDGRKILTVHTDAVNIWNVTTRTVEWNLTPEAGMSFHSAELSPDGTRIVTSCKPVRMTGLDWWLKWSVAVVDVESKTPLSPARRWENDHVSRPSFSADGKWVIASVSAHDGQPDDHQLPRWRHSDVKIWEAATGDVVFELRTPTPPSASMRTVALSPKADRIITCDGDGRAMLWPVKTAGERLTRNGDPVSLPDKVLGAVFSPDGTEVATWGIWERSRFCRIVNTATGMETRVLKGHSSGQSSVAYSPDGKRIVTASYDGTVKTWNAQGTPEQRLFRSSDVLYASFSPKGDRLLTCNKTETRVRDARTGKDLSPPLRGGSVGDNQHSAFSPDGRRIATIAGNTIRIYDANTYELRHTLTERSGNVYLMSFNPDGTRLLVASDHSAVTVWNVETGEELDQISQATAQHGYPHAEFSPAGDVFYVERLGKERRTMTGLTVYDARTRTPKVELSTGTIAFSTWNGTFSRDGKWFVGYFLFEDKPNECRVWNVTTGALERTFRTHTSQNAQLALSPDGKRLLTISDFFSVKIWDVESGLELLTLPSIPQVNSVAFHPDGTKFMAVCGWQGVHILDGTPLPEPRK